MRGSARRLPVPRSVPQHFGDTEQHTATTPGRSRSGTPTAQPTQGERTAGHPQLRLHGHRRVGHPEPGVGDAGVGGADQHRHVLVDTLNPQLGHGSVFSPRGRVTPGFEGGGSGADDAAARHAHTLEQAQAAAQLGTPEQEVAPDPHRRVCPGTGVGTGEGVDGWERIGVRRAGGGGSAGMNEWG